MYDLSPGVTTGGSKVSAVHSTTRAGCRAPSPLSEDPTVSQTFMLDRVFNPEGKALPPLRGFKYTSWSPVGCDANGRCLLAALTMDNRLTIQATPP